MKVGFIGLGRMGKGMAQRILSGNHDLAVYDVFPKAAEDFRGTAARIASSVADLAKDREVVITMLAEDSAVRDVALGAGGLSASLPKDAIHMASGTYGVETIRALEAAHTAAGQTLIAVPVLGRPDLAASGQLGVIPAGPEEAIARCEPLFQLISKRIFYAGTKPESGSAIKLANNAVLGCAITAMAEGFSLVRKFGVDPRVLYDVMTEGLFAGGVAYVGYGKTMVERSWDKVGSPITIGMKDAHLIAAAAAAAKVPLPSHDVYVQRLLGSIAHGDADLDQAALAKEQARAAGLE
ncbi:MAG TPA: NAD(P)-dependent oxidoreductase [Terriglobia bacterium]|nr:NAD(P)-dependent oxidoreductase [Terriglobia bacterium]